MFYKDDEIAHPDPRVHWTVRGRGRYFECIDDRAGSSTACVALGALTPSIASSSCRQEYKLSNDGLFVFLRRTEAELARFWFLFNLGASPCKTCSPPFMSIWSSSVHFFECSFSCRLDLLDWMSFLYPLVDWSAFAIPLNRLRVTSRSAGQQDGAWVQVSAQYFFSAFWSLRRPAVRFFVEEGLFVLFWWIGVLFPPSQTKKCDFWSL